MAFFIVYQKFFSKNKREHSLKTLMPNLWNKRWSAFHPAFTSMFLIVIIVKIINAILDFKPICQQEASSGTTCSSTCWANRPSKVISQSKSKIKNKSTKTIHCFIHFLFWGSLKMTFQVEGVHYAKNFETVGRKCCLLGHILKLLNIFVSTFALWLQNRKEKESLFYFFCV